MKLGNTIHTLSTRYIMNMYPQHSLQWLLWERWGPPSREVPYKFHETKLTQRQEAGSLRGFVLTSVGLSLSSTLVPSTSLRSLQTPTRLPFSAFHAPCSHAHSLTLHSNGSLCTPRAFPWAALPAAPWGNSVGGSLMNGRLLVNYISGTEGRREWVFSLHHSLGRIFPWLTRGSVAGKHPIDVQGVLLCIHNGHY